jgi:hypothetical protein
MEDKTHPGALFAALAKAQAAMDNVVKDSANPHFKSRFASLAAVRDVVIPALAEQGIAVVQMPGNDSEGRVTIKTVLLHESGTLDCGTVATTATVRGGNEAQALGSAVSYLRRYSLAAICGVAQEDDDGNASGPSGRSQGRSQGRQRHPTGRVPEYSVQHVTNALVHVFGDLSEEANRAEAEGMVRETTGLSIEDMMGSKTGREAVIFALRENARRGR